MVVEDDEGLGEFLGMVLDLLPVEHRLCRSAEQALEEWARAPADVLVTDLLLPGLDGRGLIRTLQANALQGAAVRLVVMSGGINDAVRRELAQLGVWRVLTKPVTVQTLCDCIEQALMDEKLSPSPGAVAGQALRMQERTMIESHFGGDEALYLAFRHGSLQQLPRDVETGDRALQAEDLASFRRVAHNLKSTLRTLALDEWAQTAQWLEQQTARQMAEQAPERGHPWPEAIDTQGLARAWAQLKEGLQALMPPKPD